MATFMEPSPPTLYKYFSPDRVDVVASGLVRRDPAAMIGPGLDAAEPTFDELALAYLTTTQPRVAQVPA